MTIACRLFAESGRRVWLALVCLIGMVGCEAPDGIRTYTVKKSPPSTRMLAAVIPRGDEAWFFKLTGPNAVVAEQAEPFENLIRSVEFGAGRAAEPTWTLPEGWVRQAGDAMRFATLEIDTGREKLECSISKLPRTEAPLVDYLLANINRWRGQMRLSSLAVSDLPNETTTVPLADGKLQATLMNIAGDLAAGGVRSAPFASRGGPAKSSRGPSAEPMTPPSPLQFQAPAGWSPGELEMARGGIVVRRDAAFEVRDGERKVEITVTKLPAAAGAVLPNVNRWRGQIGLPEITQEQFLQEKKQIEIAGAPVDYVQFFGSQQAVCGVIAERNGLAWFIKLQGDRELASREQSKFEEFVRSIRFE